MKKTLIIAAAIAIVLAFTSCAMPTDNSQNGILKTPAKFIGPWYCPSNGGMIWSITSNNAILTTTTSTLNLSDLSVPVREEFVNECDWYIYMKGDSMYEMFYIHDGKLYWKSSSGATFSFSRQ